MEFVVNPNYAASTVIGNTLGLCIALIVFGIIWVPTYDNPDKSSPYMLIWQSTLIAFPLMIFGQGIWEIIYAKVYESGSNPFYLASKAELDTETLLEHQAEEQAQESINVDL